jgi:hypothetical protein
MTSHPSESGVPHFPPDPTTVAEELGVESFRKAFRAEWDKLHTRFLKLECRQAYSQLGDPSYEAFLRNDMNSAVQHLKRGISAQKPLYDSLKAKGAIFLRLRLVEFPISDYVLKYEFEAYRIAAANGEEIYVVTLHEDSSDDWLRELFDFVLFDTSSAIVHNYDSGGELRGGWLIHSSAVLTQYANIAERLLRVATPFSSFYAEHTALT